MIGTFQGHEGASIRGACVPVTFSFSRRKSHALAERKKNPRRCASEIGRHVPYNARTHAHTYTHRLLRQFPCREFFLFLSLPDRVPAFFIFFIIGNNEPAGVTIIKKKVATRIILEKNESRKLVSASRIEP